MEEEKEPVKEKKPKEESDAEMQKKQAKDETLTEKLRENPWIAATLVLGIILLVFIIGGFSGTTTGSILTGGVISGEDIGEMVLNFYEANGVTGLELDSVEEVSGVYQVNFKYLGDIIPLYVTKDGKFVGSLSPMLDSKDSTVSGDVPKSDKPEVELFVMSMCPYGTQALKGIIPVVELLDDKIDFDLRFVSYAMHGKEEIDENTRQYCIQKEEPDKFLDYLKCYLQDSGEDSWDACAVEVGINDAKIDSCIEEADEEFDITELYNDKSTWSGGRFPLFNVDEDKNREYGVQGSPTLVINGEVIRSGRDPASYLDVICSAFNDAPSECGEELSTATPSPGFGWENTGTGSGGSCG